METSIVLVDDHILFAQGVKTMLLKEGWVSSVRVFTNPDELERVLKDLQIDSKKRLCSKYVNILVIFV